MPRLTLARSARSSPSRWLLATILAALIAITACDDDEPRSEPASNRVGPLVTSLDSGGNSVYPPDDAGTTWKATFGSLLICSPARVEVARVVPHFKIGTPVAIKFLVRSVPDVGERVGKALPWAPVGTATQSPNELVRAGKLRYASLVEAPGAVVDQPCDDNPDASYTEVLTSITTDGGGVWIDGLRIEYSAPDGEYALPVHWSYVTCGDLIHDSNVC